MLRPNRATRSEFSCPEEVAMRTGSPMPLLLALAVWLAAVGLRAQEPRVPEPQLKKEIEAFRGLQGKWSCQGVFPANGKHIESQMAFAPDLDGAWLVKRHDDLPPNVFHDAEYWGFDSASKQFVAFVYDNFGGVRKFTSSGWSDDQLTWSGTGFQPVLQRSPSPATPPSSGGPPLPGEPSQSEPPRLERFVYKRDGPRQIVVNWEVKQGAKDWAIGDTLTCKK